MTAAVLGKMSALSLKVCAISIVRRIERRTFFFKNSVFNARTGAFYTTKCSLSSYKRSDKYV
ncbi:MAG TPA: hypothetical protein DCS07_00025 [Bdellovibrionales bacterium]|nr:MAG: hypothetical protein A2X97_09680 [Bdellovibrionales bacterium GWA1_52_35]HAR41019.1 hypothetical protein [Bdellovibrionales bacterium]HCM40426.1 hypothetical protein [Bdellovibrionales bacterium]